MTWPKVSVVIVSRDRPHDLSLCLAGLAQLDYPALEVIVVANARSASAIGDHAVKLVPFDRANISAARNAGIAAAAGDIIAFIDDDAVPVPGWLKHLVFPMLDTDIATTGGYVIGRNGFSFQWTARQVHPDGQATPLDLTAGIPPGAVVKTEGTNMALRRDVALQLGFDEAFAFYLDETDLNMRLASAGYTTQLAPQAIVHHGFAASDRRTAARVPTDLTQIAASVAVFQRKHGAVDGAPERARQRARLLRHMVAGHMMPGDVRRVLAGFDQGWAEGLERPFDQRTAGPPAEPFKPFATTSQDPIVLRGRFWQRRRLLAKAQDLAARGQPVTVFLFSLTPRRHVLRFQQPGIWVQSGGQFGASDRGDPPFRLWRAGRRAAYELDRRAESWEFHKFA